VDTVGALVKHANARKPSSGNSHGRVDAFDFETEAAYRRTSGKTFIPLHLARQRRSESHAAAIGRRR